MNKVLSVYVCVCVFPDKTRTDVRLSNPKIDIIVSYFLNFSTLLSCNGVLCKRPAKSGIQFWRGRKKYTWFMFWVFFVNKKLESVVCKNTQPPLQTSRDWNFCLFFVRVLNFSQIENVNEQTRAPSFTVFWQTANETSCGFLLTMTFFLPLSYKGQISSVSE